MQVHLPLKCGVYALPLFGKNTIYGVTCMTSLKAVDTPKYDRVTREVAFAFLCLPRADFGTKMLAFQCIPGSQNGTGM